MNHDLIEAFRKYRNQLTVSSDTVIKGVPEKKYTPRNTQKGSSYDLFLDKYENLSERIDSINTKDLCFFFKVKAEEAGVKYVIANMKRDMGIFKKLREEFETQEILLMIEFIFSGDQTYLDISRTQPTVLASNWVNTIYRDSIDWANDCYTDKSTVTNKNAKREWKPTSKNSKKVKIGEW